MTGYVSADLCFIVWLHNTIARVVAHICYPLFACVSNLIIITEPPLAFCWVLRLSDYWLHHGSMTLIFFPLPTRTSYCGLWNVLGPKISVFGRDWK